MHAIRPQTCRTWFCLWRVIELSDDWRPDRSGIVVRPDGLETGEITLYVVRRTGFLTSMEVFGVVAGWVAQDVGVALSVPGPVGTYPARAVVTDWLRPAIEAGDPDDFNRRVAASLDQLQYHDWQADGITARYAVHIA